MGFRKSTVAALALMIGMSPMTGEAKASPFATQLTMQAPIAQHKALQLYAGMVVDFLEGVIADVVIEELLRHLEEWFERPGNSEEVMQILQGLLRRLSEVVQNIPLPADIKASELLETVQQAMEEAAKLGYRDHAQGTGGQQTSGYASAATRHWFSAYRWVLHRRKALKSRAPHTARNAQRTTTSILTRFTPPHSKSGPISRPPHNGCRCATPAKPLQSGNVHHFKPQKA